MEIIVWLNTLFFTQSYLSCTMIHDIENITLKKQTGCFEKQNTFR